MSAPAEGPLAGLRIVEHCAFIAAPSATMTLAQLGAEVIRLDPPGGGLDSRRWPLAPSGTSLYWSMLNRGKASVTLDLRKPADAARAADLVCGGGPGGGILVSNLPLPAPLRHDALRGRRPDVIVATLDGSPDGSSAIDYTVHAACGAAMMSGAEDTNAPGINAVPFWDIICGQTLATGLLAADRHRRLTGQGQHLQLSLSDVAMAWIANLGILAETELSGVARPRQGTWVYGSFGRDFATSDGRRVMLVAVTVKQWRALLDATGLAERMSDLARAFGADLDREEERWRARAGIAALIAEWTGSRSLAGIAEAFEGTAVCWAPFRDTGQALAEDWRMSPENPLFERISHPGIPPVLTAANPLRLSGHPPARPLRAPEPGGDTRRLLDPETGD